MLSIPSDSAKPSSSQIVLRAPASQSLVLFDPRSHQLSLYRTNASTSHLPGTMSANQRMVSTNQPHDLNDHDTHFDEVEILRCPTCHQSVNSNIAGSMHHNQSMNQPETDTNHSDYVPPSMANDYFRMLALSYLNERGVHPAQSHLLQNQPSPRRDSRASDPIDGHSQSDRTNGRSNEQAAESSSGSLHGSSFMDGYQNRFFVRVRKLGGGSFGQVFLTRHVLEDVTLGDYACKIIPVGDSRSWLSRVCREVRALETVRHRNIVTYKHSWLEHAKMADFGPPVPCLFLLMEYCNRGTVADLIWPKQISPSHSDHASRKRQRPQEPEVLPGLMPRLPGGHLAEADVWWIFLDSCSGLRHLHRCGLLHNDLKLDNLLLTSDLNLNGELQPLRVLISDFGNAIIKGAAYSRTGMTGTLAYSAPETLVDASELNGESPYSERSDLWSLGIILYCLAFSALPYHAQTVPEMRNELTQPLRIPNQPRRSSELIALIQRLLEKDPNKRPDCEQILSHPAIVRIREQRKQHVTSHHSPNLHGVPNSSVNHANNVRTVALASLPPPSVVGTPESVAAIPHDDVEMETLMLSPPMHVRRSPLALPPVMSTPTINPSVRELLLHCVSLSFTLAAVVQRGTSTTDSLSTVCRSVAMLAPSLSVAALNLACACGKPNGQNATQVPPWMRRIIQQVQLSRLLRVNASLAAAVAALAIGCAGKT